ncbi:glycosyltransferase family protein [Olleya namhaensis]|uniref:Uncharacterized protein n=1 Tax=Olleya namhaensis TaxID=1144750 RepID=A0A1I3NJP0_9FLAO|nr:hypothetical protein [Olleya namhaensis]SFJ09387.1 hypothetical protein SAMN05443431_104174 [Olleya namhaensis]
MVNRIIVSAYSVHPDQKSSEAIVNKNWLDILSKKGSVLYVITAFNNYSFKAGVIKLIKKHKTNALLYKTSKQNKGLGSLAYKVLNTLYKMVFRSNYTLVETVWVKKQAKILNDVITQEDVVWSRILPTLSIVPILHVYKKKTFPFIVNVNDPINVGVFNQNNLDRDQTTFFKTKDIAQAWTFPSSKLADRMANNYNLDRQRCFVIPHAMQKVEKLYKRNVEKEEVNFLYTGTFYKSAFTEEFKTSLINFNKLEVSQKVNFTFVLSQFDEESITWLKTSIPNVILKFKLERAEVLELVKKSDCMFVVDSIFHGELLKGKLIEALSFGIPVFGITYPNSIMDKVVSGYGSVSAYQNKENDILNKMKFFVNNINNLEVLNAFYKQRTTVLDKISEDYIAEATQLVTAFAYNRFNNKMGVYIKAPDQLNWP